MSPLRLNLARFYSFIAIVQLVGAWNTFIVPHSPGKDDTPAILAALPDFATNSTILFQEGVTYNIFTPITFPTLNNVDICIEGNLTYPTDIGTIQGRLASEFIVHRYWCSPWFSSHRRWLSECFVIFSCFAFLKVVSSPSQVPGNIPAIIVKGILSLIKGTGSRLAVETTSLYEGRRTQNGDGLMVTDKHGGTPSSKSIALMAGHLAKSIQA